MSTTWAAICGRCTLVMATWRNGNVGNYPNNGHWTSLNRENDDTDKLWDFGWFWGLLYQPHVPEASAFTFSHGPYLSRNGCSLAHITHISTSHHGCRPCDPRTGSRRSFVDRRSHPKHTCRCLRLLIHVPSSPINLCHCSESLGRIYGTCTLPASILRWLDLDLEIYTCIYIYTYTHNNIL